LTPNVQFSFIGKTAVVQALDGSRAMECTVVLPSLVLDSKITLFTKELINHLLQKNYRPTLEGKEVKFISPLIATENDPIVQAELISLCKKTIRDLSSLGSQFELLCDLVKEFKDAVEKNHFDVARVLIEAILERRDAESTQRMKALLCLWKREFQEAASLFESLGENALTNNDQAQAVEDFEKALLCNPSNSQIYKKLERMDKSSERRIQNCYLWGYLKTVDSDPETAKRLMISATKYGPNEPLLVLASREVENDDEAIRSAQEKQKAPRSPRMESSQTLRVPPSPSASRRVSPKPDMMSHLVQNVKGALSRSSKETIIGKLSRSSAAAVSEVEEEAPVIQPKQKKDSSYRHYKWQVVQYLNGAANGSIVPTLIQLWEHYENTPNWRKAEIIAKLLCKESAGIDSFLKYGKALAMNGKKKEAVSFLFGCAKKAYESKSEELGALLKNIGEIDPKWESFSANQRRVLHLLTLSSSDDNSVHEHFSTREETKDVPKSPRNFISRQAFLMDHPKYVACYVNQEQMFLFTKKKVEVIHVALRLTHYYDLVLPEEWTLYRSNLKNREFDKEEAQILESGVSDIVREQGANEDPKFVAKPSMSKTDSSSCFGLPPLIALSRQQTLAHYLSLGLVPVVDREHNVVRLEQEKQGVDIQACHAAVVHFQKKIMKEGLKDASLIPTSMGIQEFLDKFDVSPTLAQEALKSAYEGAPTRIKEKVGKLYAGFCLARKKYTASALVFRSLQTRDKEKKRWYLEKAFMCQSSDLATERALAEMEGEKFESQQFRYLYAWLQDPVKTTETYPQVTLTVPYIKLASLNQISRRDRQVRTKALKQLAILFDGCSCHYTMKAHIENLTTSDDAGKHIRQLIEGEETIQDKRESALQIIDNLIENGLYEQASKIVKITIEILQRDTSTTWKTNKPSPRLRFEGDSAAFTRRELTICAHLGQVKEIKAASQRLIALYTDKKKNDKVFAVAKFCFERAKALEKTCITSLEILGKHKEAARHAFDFAYKLVLDKMHSRASQMLRTLDEIDPNKTFFIKEEQLIIQIMRDITKSSLT
jgi:tetratricopeptide (TPR) repeat protein